MWTDFRIADSLLFAATNLVEQYRSLHCLRLYRPYHGLCDTDIIPTVSYYSSPDYDIIGLREVIPLQIVRATRIKGAISQLRHTILESSSSQIIQQSLKPSGWRHKNENPPPLLGQHFFFDFIQ